MKLSRVLLNSSDFHGRSPATAATVAGVGGVYKKEDAAEEAEEAEEEAGEAEEEEEEEAVVDADVDVGVEEKEVECVEVVWCHQCKC